MIKSNSTIYNGILVHIMGLYAIKTASPSINLQHLVDSSDIIDSIDPILASPEIVRINTVDGKHVLVVITDIDPHDIKSWNTTVLTGAMLGYGSVDKNFNRDYFNFIPQEPYDYVIIHQDFFLALYLVNLHIINSIVVIDPICDFVTTDSSPIKPIYVSVVEVKITNPDRCVFGPDSILPTNVSFDPPPNPISPFLDYRRFGETCIKHNISLDNFNASSCQNTRIDDTTTIYMDMEYKRAWISMKGPWPSFISHCFNVYPNTNFDISPIIQSIPSGYTITIVGIRCSNMCISLYTMIKEYGYNCTLIELSPTLDAIYTNDMLMGYNYNSIVYTRDWGMYKSASNKTEFAFPSANEYYDSIYVKPIVFSGSLEEDLDITNYILYPKT